jgi:hypothetical protein
MPICCIVFWGVVAVPIKIFPWIGQLLSCLFTRHEYDVVWYTILNNSLDYLLFMGCDFSWCNVFIRMRSGDDLLACSQRALWIGWLELAKLVLGKKASNARYLSRAPFSTPSTPVRSVHICSNLGVEKRPDRWRIRPLNLPSNYSPPQPSPHIALVETCTGIANKWEYSYGMHKMRTNVVGTVCIP